MRAALSKSPVLGNLRVLFCSHPPPPHIFDFLIGILSFREFASHIYISLIRHLNTDSFKAGLAIGAPMERKMRVCGGGGGGREGGREGGIRKVDKTDSESAHRGWIDFVI